MPSSLAEVCRVSCVSQDALQVEILDATEFKNLVEGQLTIGSYIKVADDDGQCVIAVVQAYRIKDPAGRNPLAEAAPMSFVLDAQPIGFLDAKGEFRRGGQRIAIPPTTISLATKEDLEAVYSVVSEAPLRLGNLAQDEAIEVPVDGDLFFSKHIAVIGSTGSGKSCTVVKILEEGMRQSASQGQKGVLNNSHIIIFDLHGEYAAAFPKARKLDVNSLKLPYWLMTAEELEEIFIMSDEQNSHNQVSQFRHAVVANKKRHNKGLSKLSFDSPVQFNLEEIYNYLFNMNSEIIGRLESENCPVLSQGSERVPVRAREDRYFDGPCKFVEQSTAKAEKATSGPFTGDFDRFVLRLRTILDDERMAFLLKPRKDDGTDFTTADKEQLIADLIGYKSENKSNVTIIDLSGIPFEVLSLVVSLISRLIFDVGFFLKKAGKTKSGNEIPFLTVYEEAHIYAPNSSLAKYHSVRKAIERIAKEGRKYGVGLMIVSQRPSEISETIFAQCNNFVAMRLTNPTDQNYVRRLLPDSVAALTESLPVLEQRQALLIGDASAIPAMIRIGDIENLPDSRDINILTEWRDDWRTLPFDAVLEGMNRR